MNTKRPTLRVILIIVGIILTLSGDFLTAAAVFALIWWLGKRTKENAADAPLPPLPADYYTSTPTAPVVVTEPTPTALTPEQKYNIPTQHNHA